MISGRGTTANFSGRRIPAGLFASLSITPVAVALASPAHAQTSARTPAGTSIVNVAELRHGPPDARVTTTSNAVALRVDTAIDVAIVARDPTLVVAPGATGIPVAFEITNLGNASTTFALTADVGGQMVPVAADDGDGTYDPTRDRGPGITLAPGRTGRGYAILPGPVTGETRVAMTATATSGTGAPGTVLPGAGPDGIDAVVGTSGGQATAMSTVTVGAAGPALVKSQSVTAPDGTGRAATGAIITYTIAARFPAPIRGAVVTDPVPAGTTYVIDSITLDGTPISDAMARVGDTVRVTLGDIAAPTVRTIRFQTKIN